MAPVDIPGHPIVGIRADNSGPFTLTGTNSWIVGRDPAWLVDPGPLLEGHVAAVTDELERRGGLGGIALTHDHADHAEATAAVRERFGQVPVAAARGGVDRLLGEGVRFGPLETVSTPGHAPDHLAFVVGTAALTGDSVLGQGSVFVAADPGALAGYLNGLASLRRRRLEVLCPGHGPPVDDPAAKLDEYIAHRLSRETRLLAALQAGARSVGEMLDAAWDDVPELMRPAATVTLAAHLDKLVDEGRLPPDVQRPDGRQLIASEPRAGAQGRG